MNTKNLNEKLLNSDITKSKNNGLGKHVAIVNCVMGAVITVLVIMVFAFLKMLFSSGADGRRETFFNTLYFEAKTLSNGNTEMTMGATGNLLPIVISVIVVTIVYFVLYCLVKRNKPVD